MKDIGYRVHRSAEDRIATLALIILFVGLLWLLFMRVKVSRSARDMDGDVGSAAAGATVTNRVGVPGGG